MHDAGAERSGSKHERVRLLEAKGAKAKAAGIHMWLQGLVAGHGDHFLPVDNNVALESGKLEAKAITAGHSPGAVDAIIAGTASIHKLTVITAKPKALPTVRYCR